MMARERGNITMTLSDKRLLSMDEFSIYASCGIVKAREVAATTGALFNIGKKCLVDRAKFDKYCDENTSVETGV